MFKRLLALIPARPMVVEADTPRGGLAALRQAYADWRFQRDFGAIMGALDRLSDRQLHMIGVSRGDLFETVEDMILKAEHERAIGREVIAMLEAPVGAGLSADVLKSPDEARSRSAA